MIAFLNLSN